MRTAVAKNWLLTYLIQSSVNLHGREHVAGSLSALIANYYVSGLGIENVGNIYRKMDLMNSWW